MQITLWTKGQSETINLERMKTCLDSPVWIDIVDPDLEDLDRLSGSFGIAGLDFIENQRSNYSHLDAYSEYVKLFSWYLLPPHGAKGQFFQRSPVIMLTNKTSIATISHSRVGLGQLVSNAFGKYVFESESIPARVTCAVLMCLLESYEQHAEELERQIDRLEAVVPPWPRRYYVEAFNVRREASRLLRLLRHFRILTEYFVKGNTLIQYVDSELHVTHSIYHRAVGVEEMADTNFDTIRDMTSLHLDTLSHDTNKTMRLLAAITALVAIPSVFGSIMGMNLIDVPWPWHLWQVVVLSGSVAILLAFYFYKKGWLGER